MPAKAERDRILQQRAERREQQFAAGWAAGHTAAASSRPAADAPAVDESPSSIDAVLYSPTETVPYTDEPIPQVARLCKYTDNEAYRKRAWARSNSGERSGNMCLNVFRHP